MLALCAADVSGNISFTKDGLMGALLKHYFQNSVIKIFNFLFALSGLMCSVSTQAEYTNCEDPVEYSVWVESVQIFYTGFYLVINNLYICRSYYDVFPKCKPCRVYSIDTSL